MAVLTLTLTGCATGVNLLAQIYDSNDICQQTQLMHTPKYQTYCAGSSKGKTYVTKDYMTNRAIVTTK